MTAAIFTTAQDQALREVRLYGVLGRRFGRRHQLAVRTPREAAQALAATVPGFGAWLIEHSEPGYQVFVGRPGQGQRGEDGLQAPVGRREAICIVPVIAGAKRGGLGQVILGAALIGLTFWNPLGLFAGQFAAFSAVGAVGKALVLGGVIQLLSPQPKGGATTRAENAPSYGFDGPVNTTQQGLPVPLTYGRVITGGAVISSGIDTEEMRYPPGFVGPIPPTSVPGWLPYDPQQVEP